MKRVKVKGKKQHKKRKAYAYVRRSKLDDTGNSMAAQERAIRQEFEPMGYEIVAVFRDEHSAFRNSSDRDGLNRLLKALDDNPDIRDVLVEQVDRLGRDVDHLGWIRYELKRRLVTVHYVLGDYDTSTPDGVIMSSVNTGMAASHSMQNSQKTYSRMRENFVQRDPDSGWIFRNGGRPQYGYRILPVNHVMNAKKKSRSFWDIDETTAPVFRRIVLELRIEKNLGYREIRDVLNGEGIPSPEGHLWTQSTVRELLREDHLLVATGKAVWNRENPRDPILRHEKGKYRPKEEWIWVENAHPALLTPEEAEAAIAVNTRRGPKTFTPRTDASPYLFSGPNAEGDLMFTCKRCGGGMVSYQKSKGKSFYACTHANNEGPHGTCGPVVKVQKEFLETQITDAVMERYDSEEFVREVLTQVNEIIADLNSNGSYELKSLDKLINQQGQRVNNLIRTIEMAGPTRSVAEALKGAEAQLEQLRTKKASLITQVQPIEPISQSQLTELLSNFSTVMEVGTNKQKRELIRAFVSRMTFDPETRQVEVFFWPSPLLGPDHYIRKTKHIFLCFARISHGVGKGT